jgi:arsenate reductase-like glutaredoxin family protein
MGISPHLIWKASCDTCRKAKKWLEGTAKVDTSGAREINASPLDAAELDRLIGTRDHRPFLNTRNELYRDKDMKTRPPARAEALKLIAAHPNLLKRPILLVGEEVLLGFDENRWKETLSAWRTTSRT